jgi:predicted aspartyl protease
MLAVHEKHPSTDKGKVTLCPIDYQVWYSRPVQQHVKTAKVGPAHGRVLINGHIAGARVQCEIDTGASHCFLSEACATAHGFTNKGTQGTEKVLLGNGEEITATGEIGLRVRLGALHFNVPFTVIPKLGSDVVLGNSLLAMTKAVVHYGSKTVTQTKGQRHATLKWTNVQSGQSSHPKKGAKEPNAEAKGRKCIKTLV